MQLKGKTILLTGGTDGIGRALAEQLRHEGARLILTGRTSERVSATRSAGFHVEQVDLSNAEGVDQLLAAVENEPIDIVINNAGVGSDHDFRESAAIDLADNDRSMYLNLTAPVHLITRLMPMLKARPEAMIVNVTSGLAIAPRAGSPIYCASKAALRSYTMALRDQLKATRIHVLEVLPPVVETKMTAGRASKKMPAKDCAAQIVGAMKRNANEANVGMVKLLRGVYSLSPALARMIMLSF